VHATEDGGIVATEYEVMGSPPSDAAGFHETLAVSLPVATTTSCGTEGAPNGKTGIEGAE
jgi:hypothetical protein